MYTAKQRAELADICYMTVEKEICKPDDEINTELISTCLQLADRLMGIKPLSEDELTAITRKIKAISVRRRKKLRIRIIAAILAFLLILGTTAYAFSDWIIEVFGIETIQTIQPGEKVEKENHEIEAPSDILYFDSVEELANYVEEPIYLPIIPDGYELIEASLYCFDYRCIDITWINGSDTINWVVNINPDYYNSFECEYYTPDGHGFCFMEIGNQCQASGWIDKNEYIILANNRYSIVQIIDKMILVK